MTDITYRLAQKRNIVTALPGPRSAEMSARRQAAVAGGVSSSAPVYAADADGGSSAGGGSNIGFAGVNDDARIDDDLEAFIGRRVENHGVVERRT